MFQFKDFFHLPQLDPWIDQMVAEPSGLIVIAGMEVPAFNVEGVQQSLMDDPGSFLESRVQARGHDQAYLSSGLSTFFDILIQTILLSNSNSQAVFIAREKSLARVPRQLKRRVKFLVVEGNQTYDRQVEYAIVSRPALLVIDRLTLESAPAVFHAARTGLKVITRIDCAQQGAGVVRQVSDLGASENDLASLSWVLSTRRVPRLCEFCRQEMQFRPVHWERIKSRLPALKDVFQRTCLDTQEDDPVRLRPGIHFYQPVGCARCHDRGRSGDVIIFDVYHRDQDCINAQGGADLEAMLACESVLTMEEYVLHLASSGVLAWEDMFGLTTDLLRRIYQQLSTSQHALVEANATLNRKLFELEASNRVLLQRTEVLISLEDLGQALIASVGLNELANRVCRRAGDLCGADRVILYLLRATEQKGDQVEVLAARGWEGAQIQPLVEAGQIFSGPFERKIIRYVEVPPGVTPRQDWTEDKTARQKIHSGLRVPLMAQDRRVGAMVVQSTQKGFFTPGETALLQTFANQAALAIQRAGLVDELRAKIDQLEHAQSELVQKERMERELELAHQVQQNLLPKLFPDFPGIAISARNEPARQVGGDFYDVIVLDEDHLGVVVADVSDKGMPAALYMALSRSLLLAEAHRHLSPKEVLLSVNRLLLELGDLNGFVSVFYGVIERSTLKMKFVRAGHERPWVIRDRDGVVDLIQLKGEGAVLGILEGDDIHLSQEEIDFCRGDRLILYSDGISDVVDERGAFFGADRLASLLRVNAQLPPGNMVDTIFDSLVEFRGQAEQFDDMTLMILAVA